MMTRKQFRLQSSCDLVREAIKTQNDAKNVAVRFSSNTVPACRTNLTRLRRALTEKPKVHQQIVTIDVAQIVTNHF